MHAVLQNVVQVGAGWCSTKLQVAAQASIEGKWWLSGDQPPVRVYQRV